MTPQRSPFRKDGRRYVRAATGRPAPARSMDADDARRLVDGQAGWLCVGCGQWIVTNVVAGPCGCCAHTCRVPDA